MDSLTSKSRPTRGPLFFPQEPIQPKIEAQVQGEQPVQGKGGRSPNLYGRSRMGLDVSADIKLYPYPYFLIRFLIKRCRMKIVKPTLKKKNCIFIDLH